MKFYPYHIFRHNNTICLINTEKMTAFDINENDVALLDFVSKNSRSTVTPEAISLLGKLDLIDKKLRKPSQKEASSKAVPVTNIALFITQECNLKCIYCYGDGGSYGSGGDMTRETAYRAVDWLIEQSEDVKKIGITFFGGEPLLNFTLLKRVVQYALKRSKETGKEFEFGLSTNASLLDDEKISFLKEYKIIPLVSFDGPKELQNTNRPFKDGKGSYDASVQKIKKLLEVLPESSCRATIVGSTDPLAVDNALREIGFATRYLSVASRSLFDDENNNHFPERDITGMLKRAKAEALELLVAIREHNTEKLNSLKNSGVLVSRLQRFINRERRFFPCGAGRASVAVSCSGDIYLCHRFVGFNGQMLGNIFSGDLDREIYQISALKFQDECSNCFAKYLCAGGCYHDNLGKTGSVFKPDENMCDLIRHTTELAATICSRLSEGDKAYLIEKKIIAEKKCPFDLF